MAAEKQLSFPKASRLLRSSEFRRVYDEGFRLTGPFFAAFCRQTQERVPPRVGFTVPRAVGKAVVRNRVKRRMRECVRLRLWQLGPGWEIVFNPRRGVADARFESLAREVERVFTRCAK